MTERVELLLLLLLIKIFDSILIKIVKKKAYSVLYELDFFQSALQNHVQDGNQVLFTTLDSLLKSLTKNV